MIETIHDVGKCTSIEELQNQIDNYNQVFMKIIRPWPGRSGYLEKFSDLTSNGMARFRFEGDNYDTIAHVSNMEYKVYD